jgi:hypothetical protein
MIIRQMPIQIADRDNGAFRRSHIGAAASAANTFQIALTMFRIPANWC